MTLTIFHISRLCIAVAILLAASSISTIFASAKPHNPLLNYTQERAEPVITLIENDPWRLVIGSDSPSFVLYSNGLVIFRTENGFQSVVLDTDDYMALLAELNIGDDFMALENYYDLALATDQPSNTIHVWQDGQRKTVSVYGDLINGDFMDMNEVPASFLYLFEVMTSYENADAQDWFPERIEVMLWSADSSTGAEWPSDFSPLNSEYSVRRSINQFSIFIEASQLDRLNDLRDQSSTLLINQTAWFYAWRVPFPNELAWQTRNLDDLPTFAHSQAIVEVFGAGILDEDDWPLALSNDYAENTFLNQTATWLREEPFGAAYFTHHVIQVQFSDIDSLAAAVDDTWLAIEWMDYRDVQIVNQCVVAETVIVDVLAVDQGLEVVARYWVWQDAPFLSEFTLVVAADDAEFEALADSLFSDTPRCPSE